MILYYKEGFIKEDLIYQFDVLIYKLKRLLINLTLCLPIF
jgi:hypothetical protein